MSTSYLAAFQGLNESVRRLQHSTGQFLKACETLTHLEFKRDQEQLLTHQALLAEATALFLQSEEQGVQLIQAQKNTAQRIERYGTEIERFTDVVSGRLEGPQAELDTLSMILVNGLREQRSGLENLNDAECVADQDRVRAITDYIAAMEAMREQIASLARTLAEADRSSDLAMQADKELETQENDRQGLALNQEAVAAYHEGLRQAPWVLLEQAVRFAPKNSTIWLNLANACLEAKRTDRAGEAVRRAAEMMPESPEIASTEGLMALDRGDNDRAIALLQRCLLGAATQANEVVLRLVLAKAYWAAGLVSSAIQQWREVLRLEPMQPVAVAWLEAVE